MNIPQYEPWIDEKELEILTECINANWITGGPKIKEFEKRIAELCQVKYAVSCVNGTMALFMGLKALGVGHSDEVIVPDFTFIASANAVVLAGANPIFVDVDDTLNINPKLIENSITVHTKAIMPVHLYGQSANMTEILKIAMKYDLKVIEDAAQGIGVSWCGKPVGGLSDVGCLSFYADKTLTTGEGGMILTNHEEIANRCLRLQNQGNLSKGKYIMESIGFNFRLTDLQAAVGLAQLGKLQRIILMKRDNEQMYRDHLNGLVEFIPQNDLSFSVPFRVIIMVDEPAKLAEYLESKGIGTRRVFYPLHLQPCYDRQSDYPVSCRAYERGLALPSSARLSRNEIMYVCNQIEAFLGDKR